MTSTIQGRMALFFAAFVLVLLGVMGATITLLAQQAQSDARSRRARGQLVLIQQMVKESFLLANAGAASRNAELRQVQEQLGDSMHEFETTLFALREGRSVSGEMEVNLLGGLMPGVSGHVRAQLREVSGHWAPFKENLSALAAASGRSHGKLAAIVAGHNALASAMASAVEILEEESSHTAKRLYGVQAGALLLSLLLVAAGGWVVRYTISKPVRRLAEAARLMSTGNLNIEVRVEGTRELVDLSESFDRMRASMLAALEAQSMDRAVGADDDF